VIRPVLPLLALLLGGCFATTQQVQQLQTQLGQMRAESARRDSVELVTLTQLVNSQQRMADSLRNVRTRRLVLKEAWVGLLNGLVCGLTGLPGFIITVWCQLRGYTKDAQRAVFQPVMLAATVMSAISLSFAGVVTVEIGKLYLLGLPALLAGLWIGFKLYGKLDDAAFRKLILVLLLISGLALIVAQGWPVLRPR